jgi:hypothetical protein
MDILSLIKHKDPLVAKTAEKLQKYQAELAANEITQSEFDELTDDLLDLKKIDEYASSVETQIMLKEAFDIMVMIAKNIPIG